MSYDIYHKYYIDKDKVIDIVKNGLVIFDSSALLDLYFYSEETMSSITENVFPAIAGQLWIPAQVYFEFLKNKDNVIEKPEYSYKKLLASDNKKEDGGYVAKIKKYADDLGKEELKEIETQLKTLTEQVTTNNKHPFVDGVDFQSFAVAIDNVRNAIEEFKNVVGLFENDITEKVNERIIEVRALPDALVSIMEDYFEIGEEYSFDELMRIVREGRVRYSEQIPPGYMDETKNAKIGLQKYGDLIVWKQILDKAKEAQKDVLLVTNDKKEDWWDSTVNSPRFELLKEFSSNTGKTLWTCTTADFLYYFESAKGIALHEVVDEVKLLEEEKRDISDTDQLYKDLLDRWLGNQTSAWIEKEIISNPEWRVFGTFHLYKGDSFGGGKCLIMLNILETVNYSRVLHSIENLYEILRYYESFGQRYEGYQFILVRSKDNANSVLKIMQEKNKLTKLFQNNRVKNTILCLEDGILIHVKSNYQIGRREPTISDPMINLELSSDE